MIKKIKKLFDLRYCFDYLRPLNCIARLSSIAAMHRAG